MPSESIKISLRCEQCGQGFTRYPSTIGRFCSFACRVASQNIRVTRTCETCGATFTIQPCYIRAGGGKFCSRNCSHIAQFLPGDRFWAKVNKDGPVPDPIIYPDLGVCWLWTAARYPNGYGAFSLNGRQRMAHVVAYILTTGHEPPLETPLITHLCDAGHLGCVRPSHLKPDTQRGNLTGMIERGRGNLGRRYSEICPDRIPRGEQVRHARVTEVQVREIRGRRARGEELKPLAMEYGVSKESIWGIVHRKTWRHVE